MKGALTSPMTVDLLWFSSMITKIRLTAACSPLLAVCAVTEVIGTAIRARIAPRLSHRRLLRRDTLPPPCFTSVRALDVGVTLRRSVKSVRQWLDHHLPATSPGVTRGRPGGSFQRAPDPGRRRSPARLAP